MELRRVTVHTQAESNLKVLLEILGASVQALGAAVSDAKEGRLQDIDKAKSEVPQLRIGEVGEVNVVEQEEISLGMVRALEWRSEDFEDSGGFG